MMGLFQKREKAFLGHDERERGANGRRGDFKAPVNNFFSESLLVCCRLQRILSFCATAGFAFYSGHPRGGRPEKCHTHPFLLLFLDPLVMGGE